MRTPSNPAHLALLLPLAGSLLAACASYESAYAEDEAGRATAEDGYGGSDGSDGGDYGGTGSEAEDDFLTLPPATTDTYVFVANPDRDTVTRISADDLGVITAEVGTNPQVVVTTDDYVTAVTFNQGSDDVSIVDAASLAVRTAEVRANFNAMELSPDGAWVVCYFNQSADSEGSAEGAQSYNEVSFVRLEDGSHHPMVVGFNPREIQFTPDGERAVVVSDSYLAIVDLTADAPTPLRVEIAEDLLDPPRAEEVLLSPDGTLALVRQFGADTLAVVDLASGALERVPVGDNPTDLDATPDGVLAVAVARDDQEVWIYDLADPFAEPMVLSLPEGELFGSVAFTPDGSQALLYSTASGASRYASWDLDSDTFEVHALVKPVAGLQLSPSGETAIVLHSKGGNGDLTSASPFYNEDAITLIDLGDHFANPIRLPDAPSGFAVTDDGQTGFLIMGLERYVEVLDLQTLLYDEIELKSAPVHVGVLPETRTAFVSQEHELGRISFIDVEADLVQTITGFELNSAIEAN